jgi:hypothetical protein
MNRRVQNVRDVGQNDGTFLILITGTARDDEDDDSDDYNYECCILRLLPSEMWCHVEEESLVFLPEDGSNTFPRNI